jgi:C4-type Zn-finger protein
MEDDELSSDDEKEQKQEDKMTCPNCQLVMDAVDAPAHTV